MGIGEYYKFVLVQCVAFPLSWLHALQFTRQSKI